MQMGTLFSVTFKPVTVLLAFFLFTSQKLYLISLILLHTAIIAELFLNPNKAKEHNAETV